MKIENETSCGSSNLNSNNQQRNTHRSGLHISNIASRKRGLFIRGAAAAAAAAG